MACDKSCGGKLPVKIQGFSGCISAPGAIDGIDSASTFGNANIIASHMVMLGAKCINFCPPTIVLQDNLSSLVAFLDANLTATNTSQLNCVSTAGDVNSTNFKSALAKMISGCNDCCVCSQ